MRWLLLLPLVLVLAACAPGSGIFAQGAWQSGGLQGQHIRTLTVDPNNPQHIYAGDARNGVFVSTDAGIHWSRRNTGLSLPTTIHALSFDGTGTKLYAATDAGVFMSKDSAQHWVVMSGLPATSYTALAFDLKAPHTIYTASVHSGVFISTNDGSSWTTANGGLPEGIIINGLTYDSDKHQLWAATNMGIYRSGDNGILWQALNTGLPPTVVVNTVFPSAISGGDQNLVFAGTNHGFFRSEDDGEHWTTGQLSLSGASVNAILIDYHKVTTLYVGIGIGVLRSDDNGQNWGGVASGLPKQPVFALAMGANGYNQLYAANDEVYLFPGNSSTFDPSQILPILLILAFFFALYRLSTRGRRRSRQMLESGQVIEKEAPLPLNISQVNAPESPQNKRDLSVQEKPEETREIEDK